MGKGGIYKKVVIIVGLIVLVVIIVMDTIPDRRRIRDEDHRYLIRDFIADDEIIQMKMTKLPNRTNTLHQNKVDVFKLDENFNFNKSDCTMLFSLRTFNGKTPIYVHSPTIDIVSSYIRDHGAWEEWLLNQTGKYLLQHPDTVFIDVGCNIGVYTLFMAKLGVQVIAIDPVEVNLRHLAMSIREGRLQDKVTVIRNAASDKYTNLLVDVPKDNIGGAHIIGNANKGQYGTSRTTNAVPTILLDDLMPLINSDKVFLKMDVEGHEYHVLQGGQTLFEKKDVKCILMEWVHHKSTDTGQRVIDILLRRGYLPYENIDEERLHPESYYRWPENVFWIKR